MGKVILITSREFVRSASESNGFQPLELKIRRKTEGTDLGESQVVDGYFGFFKDCYGIEVKQEDTPEALIPKIRAENIENYRVRNFVVGIYKKVVKDSTIYLADEFPVKVDWFEEKAQQYFDALITEIKADDGSGNEWIIISHDNDWGQNVNWTELYKEENPRNAINEKFKSLNEINELETTRVFVFQHNNNSPIYNELLGWFQNNCSEAIPVDKIFGLF